MRSASRVAGVVMTLMVLAICAQLGGCGSDFPQSPSLGPMRGTTPRAPAAIGVEPGPGLGSITVYWPPVDQAQSYVLYVGTSPGVTPATAVSRTPGLRTYYVQGDVTPGVTYYYAVAAVGVSIEGPLSPEISAKATQDMALHVETPETGARVATQIPIVMTVTETAPVQSLVASIGTASTALHFDTSIGRWAGTLSLLGLQSPASRQLTITATDTRGRTANAAFLVLYDLPPQISITAPAEGATVSANVRLAATCTDDGTVGCIVLRAYVEGFNATPLVTATSSIDTSVSLAGFTGTVRIVFEGADAAGQITRVVRTVSLQ